MYFTYTLLYSIVLIAVVDANYNFIWSDVGGVGHQSAAQIYNASTLKASIVKIFSL